MATGMADYSSVIRPTYGGAILADDSLAVAADGLTPLVQIAGKGMIYGGSVWLEPAGAQSNSQVWLRIDEFFIPALSFERLKVYGVVDPRSAIISLNVFNSQTYVYSVGISYGLTFETELVLAYNEAHGDTPTVHYRLVYTLI